ncbi:Acyl carrier protein [Actinomadura rubteroloni]|uniref:Acyl carrier protein n=1 Tax=Actinomadura rubteroloni TaxID=1926885 RepID=A0A2P4UDN0_9ACTN|nr:phosphopantetheine-binding protein [Actinomadura rubteroloni]POM23158.1 Acyl carrier protein [Actinomadura rubteroloni]
MEKEHVHAVITKLIHREVPELTGDLSAADDFGTLGIDSMTMVDLMVAAEREFGVEIADDRLADVATVGDLVDIVVAGAGPRQGGES